MNELDRFLEDQQTSKSVRQESLGEKLIRITRLCDEERQNVARMTQKYQLEKNLENMRFSGKPFYWIDHEKLKKLKQLCEKQSDPVIRERAFAALNEYQNIVEQYNATSRRKILDIFPKHRDSMGGANNTGSSFSKYDIEQVTQKVVNI